MGDQLALTLWSRDHDLPPRWDGLPVEWSEWSDTSAIFICGRAARRPERCGHCGSIRSPLIASGRIWADWPPATVPLMGRTRLAGGRRLVANIAAFRCPDCQRDHVIDGLGSGAQTWLLDETDYRDEGSWEH